MGAFPIISPMWTLTMIIVPITLHLIQASDHGSHHLLHLLEHRVLPYPRSSFRLLVIWSKQVFMATIISCICWNIACCPEVRLANSAFILSMRLSPMSGPDTKLIRAPWLQAAPRPLLGAMVTKQITSYFGYASRDNRSSLTSKAWFSK